LLATVDNKLSTCRYSDLGLTKPRRETGCVTVEHTTHRTTVLINSHRSLRTIIITQTLRVVTVLSTRQFY